MNGRISSNKAPTLDKLAAPILARILPLSRTRDIVKRVYQQLVPAALRHNIGEYFTPEWLVEFTLNRVGYQGYPILTNKFLDPCCGSGNFLIHAIERYKTEAQASGYDKATILKNITGYIYGFDLNPLAVLTARVNYLIAISDLINTESAVEIPIYQADAVYAPTVNRSFMTERTCVYQIGTRLSTINIELDLIYPLIKGAENIRAFYATTSPQYAIIPNKRITADMIPSVAEFAKQYPGALRYFRAINIGVPGKAGGLLNERSTWKTRMKPLFERRIQQGKMDLADLPFYAIYDVGDYTFSPYKVV